MPRPDEPYMQPYPSDERFDIDVGYRDPWDRDDSFPEPPPSPSEYMDPPRAGACDRCWDELGREDPMCPACGSDEDIARSVK